MIQKSLDPQNGISHTETQPAFVATDLSDNCIIHTMLLAFAGSVTLINSNCSRKD